MRTNLLVFLVVDVLVLAHSLEIVERLLDDGDCQHEHQRRDVREHEAHLQGLDELTQGDHQEEEIIKELKLVKQDQRDQGQHVVLLVVLLVRGEASGSSVPVHVDGPLLSADDAVEAPPQLVANRHSLLHDLLLSQQCLVLIATAVQLDLDLVDVERAAGPAIVVEVVVSNKSLPESLLLRVHIGIVFLDVQRPIDDIGFGVIFNIHHL